jgi:hypothetical protein
MKRERRAAAREAGWSCLLQGLGSLDWCTDLAKRCDPDGTLTPEEADLAVKTFREYLGRLHRWMQVNRPRGA